MTQFGKYHYIESDVTALQMTPPNYSAIIAALLKDAADGLLSKFNLEYKNGEYTITYRYKNTTSDRIITTNEYLVVKASGDKIVLSAESFNSLYEVQEDTPGAYTDSAVLDE